jgi:serine/threonine protein kinase
MLPYKGYVMREWGGPVLAREFVMNPPLTAVIDDLRDERGPPNWYDTHELMVIYGIAVGLAALHRAGICQGGLTTNNVVMTDAFTPLLADFGLGALAGKEDSVLGVATRLFFGPEIHAGEPASRPADVYSIGMVVYRVVTRTTSRSSSMSTSALR